MLPKMKAWRDQLINIMLLSWRPSAFPADGGSLTEGSGTPKPVLTCAMGKLWNLPGSLYLIWVKGEYLPPRTVI